MTPASLSGTPGQSVAESVTVVNSSGQADTTVAVTWSSSNSAIATVNDAGMVTLIATGSAQISATAGGVTAVAVANVNSARAHVATVRVTPSSVSLTPKQFTPLTATALDSKGTVLTGREIQWSSSNTSVATVSASGIVTAVAIGAAVITASSEGINGTANVTVAAASPASVGSVTVAPATATLSVGGTTTLAAVVKDSSGTVLAGRTITWTSNNSGVVSVASGGQVTAVAVGSATITAATGGKSGTATVTVNPAAVASVTLTPATASLSPGQTAQLTATAKDANGNTLAGRTVTWSSTPSSVTTVSATGLVTAVAAGTGTVRATIGGQSATATITVGQTPVASVTLSPSTSSLTPGQTEQLSATAKDANGNTLTGRTVTWSSSRSAVATVSATGLVSAVATGADTVTATIGGQSASTGIAVGPAPIASVAVSPTQASVGIGSNTQLDATAQTAAGTAVTGVSFTWSSSNTTAATVSSTGLVTGRAAGSATVSVSAGGKSVSAAITVTGSTSPPPVASVAVSPTSESVGVGATSQLTATAKNSSGGTISGVGFTWSSSNTGIATVSSSGLVTGRAAGTATLTATGGGQSGHASVTVTGSSSGGNSLASCGAPDLVSWDFAGGGWGPLDHTNFIGNGHIVSDATAPAGFSAQWGWSSNSGDEGGQVNATFPSRQSAYARFGYKQDPNFTTTSTGIKKILRFRASGYNQLLGTLDIDGDDYIWFWDVLDGNKVFRQTTGAHPSANRGSWHWFEVFNDISSSGNLQVKVWMDGTLIISATDAVSNQGLSFGIASPGGTFNAPAGSGTDWITSIGVGSQCVNAPW